MEEWPTPIAPLLADHHAPFILAKATLFLGKVWMLEVLSWRYFHARVTERR